MKTKIACMIAALLQSCFFAKSQQSYIEQISTENITVSKTVDETTIAMDMVFSDFNIDKDHLLILTPIIVSSENADTLKLKPVIVVGKRKKIILDRSNSRQTKEVYFKEAFSIVIRENGTDQQLHYMASVPFEKWQRKAILLLNTELIGCAFCQEKTEQKQLLDKILADEFKPDFVMNYIVPDVEPVKQRSAQYSAHLNYLSGKFELLPSYGNNATELENVDRSINVLKEDKDLTITDLTISGYASPEGLSRRNLLLSQRRAETFATYLEENYGYDRKQFKIEWHGEDWSGLRKAIDASAFENKRVILDIIDNTADEDERDNKIIALDNRQTYTRLLYEFYPPLRRNDYNISFISRAFSVDEAKEVLKENPQKLSLNEMYLVAQSYPKNSEEFKNVFDIAVRTFPDSEIACLNASITDLNNNNVDIAIQRLSKLPNSPKAKGLLGIAYIKKGEYERALQYLEKAFQQGDNDAKHNIEQLRLVIENK